MSHALAVDALFASPVARTATARVVCFPYAGGTASVFDGFSAALPGWVDVCAFEPPGRQRRQDESLADARKMDALLAPLLHHAALLFEVPYVLFGHSLGSWVAFELARRLRRAGVAAPRALLLAGARAPQLPRRSAISGLDDASFIAELRALNGTSREVLEDEALMQHVLPRIRADFALAEQYRVEPDAPLACPFVVVGALSDETVRPPHLLAWKQHCAGTFQLQLLAGDHFFVAPQRRALSKLLARAFAPSTAIAELEFA